MHLGLIQTITSFSQFEPTEDRKKFLQPLIQYLLLKKKNGLIGNLNFICTHNSRRSQMSQIWGFALAKYFNFEVNCYSGGSEVTAFHPNAIHALNRLGFQISNHPDSADVHWVSVGDGIPSLKVFSKLFDHPENEDEAYAAIMTCSHADENCPYIPNAEIRIPIRFDDPKEYDGTPMEEDQYKITALTIGSELYYVFSKINRELYG